MPNSISLQDAYTKNKQESSKKAIAEIVHQIPKIIKHFFPEFKKRLSKIEDIRKRSNYEISEIVMGAISLFLFKEGSRNALNNDREHDEFVRNYEKLFGMKLPHKDSVDNLFRVTSPGELENFKKAMIQNLILKKVLHKWRIDGKYFVVAVD